MLGLRRDDSQRGHVTTGFISYTVIPKVSGLNPRSAGPEASYDLFAVGAADVITVACLLFRAGHGVPIPVDITVPTRQQRAYRHGHRPTRAAASSGASGSGRNPSWRSTGTSS